MFICVCCASLTTQTSSRSRCAEEGNGQTRCGQSTSQSLAEEGPGAVGSGPSSIDCTISGEQYCKYSTIGTGRPGSHHLVRNRRARCAQYSFIGRRLQATILWKARDFLYFLSQTQFPVQTLVRCPYSPCVWSHASTSVRTLTIPNTGSHTIVWTHENTTHIGRNGYHYSWGCCALPEYGDPNFPQGTMQF